jgi:hypothetical protein
MVVGLTGVSDIRTLLHLAVAAFLAVAGYPLIFLFEQIFMLVSSSKLLSWATPAELFSDCLPTRVLGHSSILFK